MSDIVSREFRDLRIVIVIKHVKGLEHPKAFHFTTNGAPVTVDGIQYLPLSSFDQEAWGIAREEWSN